MSEHMPMLAFRTLQCLLQLGCIKQCRHAVTLDTCTCVLQEQTLGCLAYMNGNILSCINDGIADPMSDEPDSSADQDPNTQLVCIAVGRWPFMFVVAIEDIKPRKILICG